MLYILHLIVVNKQLIYQIIYASRVSSVILLFNLLNLQQPVRLVLNKFAFSFSCTNYSVYDGALRLFWLCVSSILCMCRSNEQNNKVQLYKRISLLNCKINYIQCLII